MNATERSRRLADLLRREQHALAEFLIALAEFDRERCWVELGHSSLFYFLHRDLRLSRGASYLRKVAAELLQAYPELIEPLRDGRLCLSSVGALSKVISAENRAQVVPRFFNASKRESMALSAELAPRAAPHRVVVTALPSLTALPNSIAVPSSADRRAEVSIAPHSAGFASGSSAERLDAADGADSPYMAPGTVPPSSVTTATAAATSPGTAIPAADAVNAATVTARSTRMTSGTDSALPFVEVAAGIDAAVHPGELLAAAHFPSAVQTLPAGGPPGAAAAVMAATCAAPQVTRDPHTNAILPPGSSPVRNEATPLTADLYRLHVTVSRRFVEKLDAARDALSHSKARGAVDEVLEFGLDLLLRERARAKGIVDRPRKKRPSRTSGPIPAAVKREVWNRDGGCCQWPLKSGGVCGSTVRVEFDHITPRARGGLSTVENLRLLCRAHNQLAARRVFGDEWMNRRAQRAASARGDPGASSGVAQPTHDPGEAVGVPQATHDPGKASGATRATHDAHQAVSAPRNERATGAAQDGAVGLRGPRAVAGAAPAAHDVVSTPRGSRAARYFRAARGARAGRARVCAWSGAPMMFPAQCRDGPMITTTAAASSSTLRRSQRMYLLRSSSAMTPSRRRRT